MSGCAKALIIVFVLAVIAVLGFVWLAGTVLNNIATNLDGDGNGIGDINDDCAFLSDADARTVLGGNADAIELSGLFDASIGLIVDKRVLANAPDCWVTDGAKAYIARIALYQGGDAASLFAAELTAAQPSSQDQGGGVSVENPGYFAGEVAGLGDEAFCTDLSPAIMAGVLVHQGDRLVYVSVGAADENQPSLNAADYCATAQEVARFILR